MLDIAAETAPDLRPTLALCAWGGDTSFSESGASLVQVFSTRVELINDHRPEALAERLIGRLWTRGCNGLLLTGPTRLAGEFRLQTRAENRALGGRGKLDPTGPAVARATAPIGEIVRSMGDAGLAVAATSEAEDDLGSYLLYRVLTALPDDADAAPVALLRSPPNAPIEDQTRAVRATAQAMARHFSPSPRRPL